MGKVINLDGIETQTVFLLPVHRLNVAVTRARFALWIVGNATTLRAKDATWRSLLIDADSRGCVRDAGRDAGMRGVVQKYLTDQGDLEALFKPDSHLFEGLGWKVKCS